MKLRRLNILDVFNNMILLKSQVLMILMNFELKSCISLFKLEFLSLFLSFPNEKVKTSEFVHFKEEF